jgi:hypothetical protein
VTSLLLSSIVNTLETCPGSRAGGFEQSLGEGVILWLFIGRTGGYFTWDVFQPGRSGRPQYVWECQDIPCLFLFLTVLLLFNIPWNNVYYLQATFIKQLCSFPLLRTQKTSSRAK